MALYCMQEHIIRKPDPALKQRNYAHCFKKNACMTMSICWIYPFKHENKAFVLFHCSLLILPQRRGRSTLIFAIIKFVIQWICAVYDMKYVWPSKQQQTKNCPFTFSQMFLLSFCVGPISTFILMTILGTVKFTKHIQTPTLPSSCSPQKGPTDIWSAAVCVTFNIQLNQ